MAMFSRSLSRRRRFLLMPGSETSGEPIWFDAGDGADLLEGLDEAGEGSTAAGGALAIVEADETSPKETPPAALPYLPLPSDALELVLTSPDGNDIERVRIDETTCVVGSGSQSDLRLPHPDVSRCHALLHRIGERLLVADLRSRTGIVHNGQRRTTCWFSAGDVLQLGPYTLRWPSKSSSEETAPPGPSHSVSEDLPTGSRRFAIRISDGSADRVVEVVETSPGAPVFLIGRDPACGLRLRDKNVARVHVALLILHDHVLAIDLVRRGEVTVNGKTCSRTPLRPGDELRIGPHRLQLVEPLTPVAAAAPRAEAVGIQTPTFAESPEAAIRTLVAALANLQRQYHDQSRRQAELLTRLAESVPDEMRNDILAEIEQLRAVIGEFDAVARQERARPMSGSALTDADRALIVSQSHARRPRPAGDASATGSAETTASRQPLERPPIAAHYGRIAQRIASHPRTPAKPPSRWKRLRSVFLPG